jgi:hypothetical protein
MNRLHRPMKMLTRYISFLLLLISFYSCSNNSQFLKEVKDLPYYPSASGIEFSNGNYYIMGDDATHLLVLDSNLAVTDSISLFKSSEKRIPKDSKPDLEALTMINRGKNPQLLMMGSGSLEPFRNTSVLFNTVTKLPETFRMDTFFHRLKYYGLQELNIEGLCYIPGNIVFSNRGHKGSPKNHLVFTSADFLTRQSIAPVTIIKVGNNQDSMQFQGVSGLAYARRCDKLLLTVSTEDTRNVLEDGAIGKSYLWIIDNISSKKRWNSINPTRIIDLEKTDPRFKRHKIESVCVVKETKNFLQLALVADDDDGSSVLFKLDISKK